MFESGCVKDFVLYYWKIVEFCNNVVLFKVNLGCLFIEVDIVDVINEVIIVLNVVVK